MEKSGLSNDSTGELPGGHKSEVGDVNIVQAAPYTHAVVKEVLRMFTGTALTSRVVVDHDMDLSEYGGPILCKD